MIRLLFRWQFWALILLNHTGVLFAREDLPQSNKEAKIQRLSLVQDTLILTHKEDILYFSIRAFAPQGLKNITIEFLSPSREKRIIQNYPIESNKNSKLVLGHITFTKKSEKGVWTIDRIIINCTNGKKVVVAREMLEIQNFSTTILVLGKGRRY